MEHAILGTLERQREIEGKHLFEFINEKDYQSPGAQPEYTTKKRNNIFRTTISSLAGELKSLCWYEPQTPGLVATTCSSHVFMSLSLRLSSSTYEPVLGGFST